MQKNWDLKVSTFFLDFMPCSQCMSRVSMCCILENLQGNSTELSETCRRESSATRWFGLRSMVTFLFGRSMIYIVEYKWRHVIIAKQVKLIDKIPFGWQRCKLSNMKTLRCALLSRFVTMSIGDWCVNLIPKMFTLQLQVAHARVMTYEPTVNSSDAYVHKSGWNGQ